MALYTFGIVLAACSGDGTAITSSATRPSTTSTSVFGTSTTAPPPPSTTVAPEPTTTLPDEPQPEGSGCTPETDDLPDGT